LRDFEFWDVAHGRARIEPGPYELLVGASSEDVRLRTTIELEGEPAGPRPVRERGLDAADFDEQQGVAIVDRTKVSGDAVTPVDGGTGELLFRACDFGDAVTGVSAQVAGEGTVEVLLGGDEPSAVLTLGAPTGPYDYTTVDAALTASGVQDVRLRLRGPLRLAHVGFSG
jgi:beta-glucosidase